MMQNNVIRVENLSYEIQGIPILDNVSVEVNKGEFVGILGPNGSGKSTMLKNIYKMLLPTKGNIYLNQKSILSMNNRSTAKKMAVVAQENNVNFDFTVEEIVQMGRYPSKTLLEGKNAEDGRIVRESLAQVGMENLIERSYIHLSGGEKQRVLIARALAQSTDVIILDEPTNHLDIGSQIKTLHLLKNANKTVLAALHDLSLAAKFCDRIYILDKGKILEQGKPHSIITADLIQAVYHVQADVFLHKNKLYIDYET